MLHVLLWAGGFSCSLNALHGGLERENLNFDPKIFSFFICKIFKSMVIKTCDLIRIEINRNLCMNRLYMKHL